LRAERTLASRRRCVFLQGCASCRFGSYSGARLVVSPAEEATRRSVTHGVTDPCRSPCARLAGPRIDACWNMVVAGRPTGPRRGIRTSGFGRGLTAKRVCTTVYPSVSQERQNSSELGQSHFYTKFIVVRDTMCYKAEFIVIRKACHVLQLDVEKPSTKS
jgi:hypothetical protein